MKIGDTIWKFDHNSRRYDPKTHESVYAAHFSRHQITGETPRSWLVKAYAHTYKVNKQTMQSAGGNYGPMRWYSTEGKDVRCWVHEHHRKIVDRVNDCDDITVLKAIATLVGYDVEHSK